MSEEKPSSNYEVETVQPKQGVWRTFDGTDGLPATNHCFFQDRRGYLWVGTSRGLFRYDGIKFTNYIIEKGNLKVHNVYSICEDHLGQLWIGTNDGAFCHNGETFSKYNVKNGLADDIIMSIYLDSHDLLWFGTAGGASCYDGVNFINYTKEDGLANDFIASVYEDSRGRMWFNHRWINGGFPSGATCFDGKRFNKYTPDDGLASGDVFAICEDNQGQMWFATYNGASCYDGQRFINYTTEHGLPVNLVISLYKDNKEKLWLGTWGGGACYFDGMKFDTYTIEDGLLENRVYDILQDREGNFWFRHKNSGLTYFSSDTCQLITERPVSEALIQASKGSLWFGDTTNHLCRIHNRQLQCQIFNKPILSLMEDSDNHLWVGTDSDGLYFYESIYNLWEEEPKHYTEKDGLIGDEIWSIVESRNGTIWVGTFSSRGDSPGYLCRFDGNRFSAIQTPHILVQRLLEDSHGRLWMAGFRGGGLSCYDPSDIDSKYIQNYSIEHGLLNDAVLSIVEDDNRRLWLGTGNGLCCLDGQRLISYIDEISDCSPYQISAKDVNGQLWFGTLGSGIYRYDGKHFQQLTKADGLSCNTITGFAPQSDGSMIIGTYSGIIHYHPTAKMPPGIEITEVIADKVYPHPNELELTNTEGDLVTISYQGVSLSTRRMRYSYILDGYEQEWQDTWESQIRYEKLPVGEYTFRVIAINRDLVCSNEPATLNLSIIPDPRDKQIAQLESALERRNRELEAELQDAREMQIALLPEAPPPIEGMEIAGRSMPANTVGGDFFDYLELPDGKVGIAIADVSGKGLRAAMNATMANGMMHEVATIEASCGRILSRLNAHLYPLMEKQMFTAFSLAILDQDTGVIQWSSAGQPLPMIKRSDGVSEAKGEGELPLGMAPDVAYQNWELRPQIGDIVIFYTDGIIEAENEAEEMYGTERLEKALSGIDSAMSSSEIIDAILKDVTDFTGSAEQYDDMTIVVTRKL